MYYSGIIKKMEAHLDKNEPQYSLPIGDEYCDFNRLLNHNIKLSFNHQIFCIKCNQKIKKTFAQGFCFPCFRDSPETSECILRPELCRAHEGESRDMEWSERNCLQKQYVYMSFTGNLKVGVTRFNQIPTRWIDQGATKAVILCITPNRYLAGVIEVFLKEFYSDRTNWRKMLSGNFEELDFKTAQNEALELLDKKFSAYTVREAWQDINFPIIDTPNKIKSFSFDKHETYEDTLIGIKGQYLLFKNDTVLNIRKHTGYDINITE